jgi:hypothetical protein
LPYHSSPTLLQLPSLKINKFVLQISRPSLRISGSPRNKLSDFWKRHFQAYMGPEEGSAWLLLWVRR